MQEQACANSSGDLRRDIPTKHLRRNIFAGEKSKADRRVQVRAGNWSEREHQNKNGQPECSRNAGMSDSAMAEFIDDDCACSAKDKQECSEKFGNNFFPHGS